MTGNVEISKWDVEGIQVGIMYTSLSGHRDIE